MELVLGTRKSNLALWQANHVKALLDAKYGDALHTRIEGILSTGDKNLEIALSAFSDKGVFTKELDVALLNKDIDIAVHSMKDLPTTLPEGIFLAAVPPRGSVYDAIVFPAGTSQQDIEALGAGKDTFTVGSSSLRRRAMLARWFEQRGQSNLETLHVRGNVNTRLKKLDEGQYDALLLAAAGLERLDMEHRISMRLTPPDWQHYAVCQGALAVVCREDDAERKKLVSALTDRGTHIACVAERSMLRTLEGGCKVPIGVKSELSGLSLSLSGIVLSTDGKRCVEAMDSASLSSLDDVEGANGLGEKVAIQLLNAGADAILREIREAVEGQSESKA